MPTSQKVSALIVVSLAALGVIYTLISGNEPLLGLDLQGGVSVVLEPTGSTDGESQAVTDESLDLTVELLRSRIDEIGVAEPEISRQGDNIVVGLPGLVEEQEEALARLRQTAELRFRPVLLGPEVMGSTLDFSGAEDGEDQADEPGDSEDGSNTNSDDNADGEAEESVGVSSGVAPVLLARDDSDSAAATTSSTAGSTTSSTAGSTTSSTAGSTTSSTTATTTEPADDSGDGEEAPADGTDGADVTGGEAGIDALPDNLAACLSPDNTADEDDLIDQVVILSDDSGARYCLGPAILDGERLTGDMIETASVGLSPGVGWLVNPTFNSGPDGIDRFNTVAAACFFGSQDVCPTTRLAVVLDHQVISAPVIQAGSFGRDQIQITGNFEEEEARRLAEALRFGALPLELVAQETRTVSASIGQDVLRAGVIAGLIGLVLVAVYLLAYYRLSGLVAISGLLLSAALLWTIIAWFGETFGLALSLAGVVGLIVSIGVSTDSNIVYFENVKDSYRAGRRVPTAIERAYESAISTIVKADIVSLIAAVLLYFLTVGAVRGFAFYLGLATILDLIISWMFMRPALAWLARRPAVEKNPKLLGLPSIGDVE